MTGARIAAAAGSWRLPWRSPRSRWRRAPSRPGLLLSSAGRSGGARRSCRRALLRRQRSPRARSRPRSPPTMPTSPTAFSISLATGTCRSMRALAAKVETANAGAATAARSVESFARGLITGEPEDLSGLAGTAVGDLFVFGDIRDAVREGTRLATGQQADELILGLACVGLAITAGTYATLGAAAPARVGMTVVKAARKTGRIGGRMAAWINRSVREVVDWASLRSAIRGASMTQPAAAVRAAREAVKVEKARDLVRLVGDVGRVQTKAGTQAALDGLKLAEGPRDMSRIARLAAAKGGKTRAILKLAGRSAIVLTVGAFNLANWMLWALVTAFGLVSALKRMTERATERYCARRRRRMRRVWRANRRLGPRVNRMRRRQRHKCRVIAFPAPTLVPIGRRPAAALGIDTRRRACRRRRRRRHTVPACCRRSRQELIVRRRPPSSAQQSALRPSERHAALCPRRRRHRVSR